MKKAFTIVELIFVLVIAGILMAVVVPKMGNNKLYEAADQVLSHIRYTQHLAMQDNKFSMKDPEWYKSRWQLMFYEDIINTGKCDGKDYYGAWGYSIFADKRGFKQHKYSGKPNLREMAKNPQNTNHFLSGGFGNTLCVEKSYNPKGVGATSSMRLGEAFGIKDVKFSKSCTYYRSKRISFDNLGRPLYGALNGYTSFYGKHKKHLLISKMCVISLCTVKPCPKFDDGDTRVSIAIEPETGYVHIL